MKRELYEALIAALQPMEEVRHIDLWNRNVEFLEEDTPFDMPAVFIEIGEITWAPIKGPQNCLNGSGTVILHVVTQWNGSSAADSADKDSTLEHLDLWERIQPKVEGLRGEHFRDMSLRTTMTSHDHEDIVESVDVYSIKYSKRL